MNCDFGAEIREDRTYRCRNPGCDRVRVTDFAPWQLHYRCRGRPVPRGKPGTALWKLNQSLDIKPKAGCKCRELVRRMDALGVDGCREHRAELLAALQENYALYSRMDKVKAALHSLTTGVAFCIDPRDPLGSLFDEAIRRAEVFHAQ